MSNDVRARIRDAADRVYGRSWMPDRYVSAPGRIELIGNHLDYNGGPVLAAAIDRRIAVASRTSGSEQVSALFVDFDPSANHPAMVAVGTAIRDMTLGVQPENYLIGAIQALDAHGIERARGIEMVVAGNLPHGVGISSSAALCVSLVATLARDPSSLDNLMLVQLAREAENRTGSPCGAMDQSASVFGDAIRFDGSDGSVQPLRTDLGEHAFLLADSNVVRSLATSSYPIRVRESAEALSRLHESGWPGLPSLAALPVEDLPEAERALAATGGTVLFKRVRHIASETRRVQEARTALDEQNWIRFGTLMTESGRSSALDYEISHPDVEELVGRCLEVPGVLGARMMGGGEGGSVLALFRRAEQEAIVAHLERTYYAGRDGQTAAESVRTCSIDHGLSIAAG